MKVWQEEIRDTLFETLIGEYNDDKTLEACRKLIEDDTGGTDELTQLLAKHLFNALGGYL